jgi:hypothetical protein
MSGSSGSSLPCFYAYNSGAVNCNPPPSTISCAAGRYFDGSSCHLAPGGTFVPYANSSIIYICPSGTNSSVGSLTCHNCSESLMPGTYLCEPKVSDVCKAGQYNHYGSCLNVTAGYQNPFQATNAEYACDLGTYSTGGAKQCSFCPSYTGTTTIGQPSCVSCPAGYFMTTISYGYICEGMWAGDYLDLTDSIIYSCPPGKYSPPLSNQCFDCPAGFYQPNYGMDFCYSCGYSYSKAGASSCTSCSAISSNNGAFCPSAITFPSVTCVQGQYLNASGCAAIPSGYYAPTPQSTAYYSCPGGQIYDGSSKTCVSCPSGYFSVGGQASCTMCPAGTYFPYTGGSYCYMCGGGQYSFSGSSVCFPCPAGTISYSGASICTPVMAGLYSSASSSYSNGCSASGAPGAASCNSDSVVSCSSGNYYSYSGRCQTIPPGYTVFLQYPNMIFICPAGYFSPTSSTACKHCPTASFPGAASCSFEHQTCGAGQIRSGGVCTSVSAGFFNPFPNTGATYACQPGYYSSAGASVCQQCPSGKYASEYGSSACTVCPPGQYAIVGYSMCYNCGTNSYSVSGVCLSCPRGTIARFSGSSYCSVVSAGSYYSRYNGRLLQCAFARSAGALNCDVELINSACAAGTYSKNGVCISAPAGYFTPVANSAVLYICPAGYYSTGGATGCTVCSGSLLPGAAFCSTVGKNCTYGYYSNGIICVSAPAGFFSHVLNSLAYYGCPPDMISFGGARNCTFKSEVCSVYSAFWDAVNPTICGSCSAMRYFYNVGNYGVCASCSAGTVSSSTTNGCASVPLNFVAHPGLSSRQPCPAGSYTYGGSPYCQPCPPYYYSNGTITSGGCTYCALSTIVPAISGLYGMVRCGQNRVSSTCLSARYYDSSTGKCKTAPSGTAEIYICLVL